MPKNFLNLETEQLYFYGIALSLLAGSILLPLLNKFMRAHVSPYGKANEFKRVVASSIDLMFCALLCYPAIVGDLYFLIFGASYFLFKDALWEGRSLGKALLGLFVIRLQDGKPCKPQQALLRNVLFLFPGLNLAALVFELMLVFNDQQGMRLGDKLAHTQVVEGKKVPQLAKWIETVAAHFENMQEFPAKERPGTSAEHNSTQKRTKRNFAA